MEYEAGQASPLGFAPDSGAESTNEPASTLRKLPAMSHGHAHEPIEGRAPVRLQRLLLIAVSPFVLATLVGLVWLWPGAQPEGVDAPASAQLERYEAIVEGTDSAACPGVEAAPEIECLTATVLLTSGPDEGERVELDIGTAGEGVENVSAGDRIIVTYSEDAPPDLQYTFSDYQRGSPLIVLLIVFAAVVVLLSRRRGLAALAGLGVSLFVLVRFVMPAILEGRNPLVVTIVGAAAIMFVTLYLAHGFNVRTTTAVLGTLGSLTLTGILALVFVEAAQFTGLASEEALFLQISAEQVNLKGLLLGGVIIGALGVLDDVTVTQSSAVWELHRANPSLPFKELYGSGLRIGRDHIASTVNTLVLAYAGSSLPLLMLFAISQQPLAHTITGEVVAEEVVRTLVGSIGLVASVPITTALAAASLTKPKVNLSVRRDASTRTWEPPRAEREWRDPDD